MSQQFMEMLSHIRGAHSQPLTKGLSDQVIETFLSKDANLGAAIKEAHSEHDIILKEFPELARLSEKELIDALQHDYVNFYPSEQTNPYVALAARGPWIVTFYGAVLHDSGGYGMLGLGHSPQPVIAAMSKNHVMANIMTANFSQARLVKKLRREIGHTRSSKPFSNFICMNSGSEAVTVAARISDIHAKRMTDQGGKYAGRRSMFLALTGGFHGRTERPAQASSSSRKNYDHLASFRNLDMTKTVEPNNIQELEAAFKWADDNNVFFEMMFMEPVMGEGNPGCAITPEFYRRARELTQKHDTFLLVDSIQAGLRARGVLSICDYPGFQELDCPDMETYSKALNAGQFPLSILALDNGAAKTYIRGVYGNTMTTNPRALEVACAVLDGLTSDLRKNIVERGKEFLNVFNKIREEFPHLVTEVQGTGLLCAIGFDPNKVKVVGYDQLEEKLRRAGIGVIHGGKNALRFTPHFAITSAEVDLIYQAIRQELKNS